MSENKFKIRKELRKIIQKKKKGFTLIELIVVIAILTILGTISFISFQNYTKSARDGTRIADINNIKKNLEIFITEKSFYPTPDNGTMIKYDGALVRTQGTVGDTVTINLGRMSKKPVDPLTESEYTYSVANNRVEYQIGAISEEGAMAYINPLTNNAYAASSKKALAMITGTYNEKFLKVSTGGINYVLTIPSIISANIENDDVEKIIENNEMVFNNYPNLPDSYKNNGYDMTGGFDFKPETIIAFSGAADFLDSEENKLALANNLESIYKDTIIETEGIYQEIFNTANDTDKVFLINNYIANNVGGITGQVSAITYRNCTLDGQTITHGETRDAYSENTILYESIDICLDKKGQITCNDGTLSNNIYIYLNCVKGPADNCLANPSYVNNTHTYNIPAINHGLTATNITSSDVSENNGVFYYTLTSIECIDGVLNSNENPIPTNKSCDTNYIWNSGTSSCEADTQIVTCGGTTPSNATATTLDTYTQTWNGTTWTPTTNWGENQTTCDFDCDTNYTWNGTDNCDINSYTVTFDGNGLSGHTPTSKSVVYSTEIGTLPTDPIKTGYTFTGWFTNSTGGTQITTSTIITGDTTFYAQWLCGTDYYESAGECIPVGNGYYSPDLDNTRTACTNYPDNTSRDYTYTSDGGGANSCTASYTPLCGLDLYESVEGTCSAVGVGYYSPANNNTRTVCTNYPDNASRNYTYTSDGNGTNSCTATYTPLCGVDLYESVSGTCSAVGVGNYSPNLNNTITACTNKPANTYYTTDGNGTNNCGFACNSGYTWNGSSCVACISGWTMTSGICYKTISNPTVSGYKLGAGSANSLWIASGGFYCNEIVKAGSSYHTATQNLCGPYMVKFYSYDIWEIRTYGCDELGGASSITCKYTP